MAHIIDYLWLHKERKISSTKLIVCTVQYICVHATLPALVPTNQSNEWGRILLKKLRVLLLVKKFFMQPEVSLPCPNSPHLIPILSQMNEVHIFLPYFLKIHFNIILHLRLCLPSDSFPTGTLNVFLFHPVLTTYHAHFIFSLISSLDNGKCSRTATVYHACSTIYVMQATSTKLSACELHELKQRLNKYTYNCVYYIIRVFLYVVASKCSRIR